MATQTLTIEGTRIEWDAKAAEGFSLGGGQREARTWFGIRVRYRVLGTRIWRGFNLLEVHSWETERIEIAITHHRKGDLAAEARG